MANKTFHVQLMDRDNNEAALLEVTYSGADSHKQLIIDDITTCWESTL